MKGEQSLSRTTSDLDPLARPEWCNCPTSCRGARSITGVAALIEERQPSLEGFQYVTKARERQLGSFVQTISGPLPPCSFATTKNSASCLRVGLAGQRLF